MLVGPRPRAQLILSLEKPIDLPTSGPSDWVTSQAGGAEGALTTPAILAHVPQMSLDGNPAVLSLRTLFWSQCFERARRHFDAAAT